jgi:Domain of unknown function (DUF4158)/Tn3 transposase DDE domain
VRALDKNLTIVSEAERAALYGLPDFDDFQRAEYFALTANERTLAQCRAGLCEQITYMLQIGYFKAKQAFFKFRLTDVPQEDIDFLMRHYFPGQAFRRARVRQAEYYRQRGEILRLFGYRPWSQKFMPLLSERAAQQVRRDVTPGFVLTELIALLKHEKIVRPGYNTLQPVISEALAAERRRLGNLICRVMDRDVEAALEQLLVREETLSELATVKQDAKNFGYRMMVLERQKRALLAPLYRAAKELLPKFDISQQNLSFYASLTTYYTIYDLRRLKPEQTRLYLLCYAWQRYRQLSDNLADAFDYHMKQIEQATKASAEQQFAKTQVSRERESPSVGKLLLLYVDEALEDATPFGSIRHQAFTIIPKETLLMVGQRFCEKPANQIDLRWQAVDKLATRFIKHLRPIAIDLEFSSLTTPSPWLAALGWMKKVFARKQRLAQRPSRDIPQNTIPKRLQPYLLAWDHNGNSSVHGDRYEFWLYRQVRKRLDAGEIYLDDSVRRRRFTAELVRIEQKEQVLKNLDIPWLNQPVEAALESLFAELRQLWQRFDCELRQGKLKHLEYDSRRKTLSWRKPKIDREEALQTGFYGKLPAQDIADVFRLVNERCRFLAQLTPLQPRYAKKIADEDSLMAVILAQAMNHGNLSMSETSDIPYHVLEATHQQYLRLSTLKKPTIGSATLLPGSLSFRTTRLTWKYSTEVSTGRNSSQRIRPSKHATRASTSAEAKGLSLTLSWPTTSRCRPN